MWLFVGRSYGGLNLVLASGMYARCIADDGFIGVEVSDSGRWRVLLGIKQVAMAFAVDANMHFPTRFQKVRGCAYGIRLWAHSVGDNVVPSEAERDLK